MKFVLEIKLSNMSSSILFKYERSMGHLFVLSWARGRRVALGSVVSE